MSSPETVNRHLGNHETLTPQLLADADLLRLELGTTILQHGGRGIFNEGRYNKHFSEQTDEQLLAANKIWQSDDIWE